MIYLDNAATTLHKPQAVIDAVVHAMQTAGNPARGAHACALSAARTVYRARTQIAELFGCPRADHVVFAANATEALQIAIHGALNRGDHVITTDLEHNSVLRPLYRLEDAGLISLDFVRSDSLGRIDPADFERYIRPNTRAIVCTHASNLTGNVVDVRAIGEIARSRGILLIVDAAQTAGAVPIDMEAMGIDVLCFTGHKGLMGPQGTGGLCVREGVELRPWKVGGTGVHSYLRQQPQEMPTRLEAGTLNTHSIAGLSAAIDFIREIGVEKLGQKEQALAQRFYAGVSAIDGVRVYGDFSAKQRTGTVALNIRDLDSAVIADDLAELYGIAARPGAHCAPRMHEALGTVDQGAVRFSFSWFNTEEEADRAIEAVRALAE